MSIVHITKEEAARPHLPGGEVGPGRATEADVTLTRFEYPAESRTPGWWEKAGKPNIAWFGFEVVRDNGEKVYVDHFVRTTALKRTLLKLGVEVAEDAEGGFDFIPGDVAGRKVSGLRLKEPREYQGEMYTGDVIDILA